MNLRDFAIEENRPIAKDTFLLRLRGDTDALTTPGQFVNLRLEGFFLRRPISVCDWDGAGMTLIYKIMGKGTGKLAAMRPGDVLELLCGLGNGFDAQKSGQSPLLIGGGVGSAPLYGLCKRLLAAGKTPRVILGFNTANEAFFLDEFRALGAAVVLATVDGSAGVRGFVTDVLLPEDGAAYYYACGPEPMLRAVWKKLGKNGQLSFEERMGCGFGACMGCSCRTLTGAKRICREGPVLEGGELLW